MPPFSVSRALLSWRWASVALLLGGVLAAASQAAAQAEHAEPVLPALYRFDVKVHPLEHAVDGTLTIQLQVGDPRIGPEWLLFLLPNRFKSLDLRGPRRNLDALPFERQVSQEELDPLLPNGFAPSGVDVATARDAQGPLALTVEPNPRLPPGYSVLAGWLRVRAPDGRPLQTVTFAFRTVLPNRYLDGWTQAGLYLENWHPALANFTGKQWVLDPDEPRPAVFSGTVSSDQPGWLLLGTGQAARVEPGDSMRLSEDTYPARTLPLVFLHKAEGRGFRAGPGQGISLYQQGGERLDRVSRSIAERFIDFMGERYGLSLPELRPGTAGKVVLVQWDLPVGDMRTLGHLVLIPSVHSHDNPILDRVYAAKLARALGRIWFGETVWANEDTEAWLPLGVSGYLALQFFENQWGVDARIHTIADWLNPSYRDNFLEAPVRLLMQGDQDAPLLISLTRYPYQQTAIVVAHYKTVLVLRTLSFVAGVSTFPGSIAALYTERAHRKADHDDLRRIVERDTGQNLGWFFSDWFLGKPRMDYEITGWSEAFSENGYGVEVEVKRSGISRMPVDVEVTDVTGSKTVVRYDGIASTGRVYIPLKGEPATIRVDPQEYLLEIDRRNNQTSPIIRFRPFYDWTKQSEVLITLQGRIGGNAIDGNYAGLGVAVPLNETTTIEAIPIYGEHTQWNNYELNLSHTRFILPRLDLQLSMGKLGGTTSQVAVLNYSYLTPDWLSASSGAGVHFERVEAAARPSGDRTLTQPEAQTNNLSVSTSLGLRWNQVFRTSASVDVEHSEPEYDSSFTYTRLSTSLSQSINFTSNHVLDLTLLRTGILGQAPIQKESLIGGPNLLRGYPRTLNLVSDQVAGARINYEATLARGIWGEAIQMRKVGIIFFADVAKGWDNHQSPDDVRQRQDVGVGLDIRVNVISFVEFPIRADVAFPLNDSQYKSPQIILFEALAFF